VCVVIKIYVPISLCCIINYFFFFFLCVWVTRFARLKHIFLRRAFKANDLFALFVVSLATLISLFVSPILCVSPHKAHLRMKSVTISLCCINNYFFFLCV